MKIAVIGGGPAGIMAAIKASERAEVHLFEGQNRLGQKLLLTGGGRCNLCNDCGAEEFFAHVVNNPRFLYSAYYGFPKESLKAFFEEEGVELKVEEEGKVFPVSDSAEEILSALIEKLREHEVHIHGNQKIGKIEKKEIFHIRAFPGEGFDRVILACGGKTYPQTGSDGLGYSLAEEFGHKIIPPVAGLVGLRLTRPLKDLQGISMEDVLLVAEKEKERGHVLFTHFGLSGPAALRLSSSINRREIPSLKVDFLPDMNDEVLAKWILDGTKNSPKKEVLTLLATLFPKALAQYILDKGGVPVKRKLSQMTKKERISIINMIKRQKLSYAGLFEEKTGIVTSGGVDVREIHPGTMESKLIPGLYFAGEMMDVDGLTGGYNLQIAFSTGYLAGENASR